MRLITKAFFQLKDSLWHRIQERGINYDENKVPVFTLPNPLKLLNGDVITCPKDWMKKRRSEIIDLFRDHVYGDLRLVQILQVNRATKDTCALSGLATRKEITLNLKGLEDDPKIHLLLYLPNHVPKPVPLFLGLNFFGNHTIHPDPGISITPQWRKLNRHSPAIHILPSEENRGKQVSRWPLEKILQRGYGLATVYYGDIEADFQGGWHYGIRSTFCTDIFPKEFMIPTQEKFFNDWQADEGGATQISYKDESCGSISVWAWGLSRIMDYIELDSDINTAQVVLFGHSRLGKTALWAGAKDDRFAIVISNNSGCVGAALSRRCFGETVKLINQKFPHWFCKKLKKYNGKEDQLPVDQHMLIALIAPRPVYIASAEQDLDADPFGEFLSAKHAEPVYALF